MATQFHLPVTAAQVGTYFVGQYYQVLQQQPDFVHQFYGDSSTMLRIDSSTRETASGMLQIHTLIMSLHYTGIEIKTAHSLESWNGGVLVMVTGSVNVKSFNGRRKFTQTFFLAPQEKGYYVLNDIFHFMEEEQILPHPVAYLPQSHLDAKLNTSATIREQAAVTSYMLGGEIQSREYVAPAKVEENGPVNSYSYHEERLQQVPEAEKILEDNYAVHANGPVQDAVTPAQDHMPVTGEESVGEPQKHTYASILAKGQTAPAVPLQSSSNKVSPASSDWQQVPEASCQPTGHSPNVEGSLMEHVEEFSAVDDEFEFKSVYVRNVPTTMDAFEIEEEFKKFGKLKPDGVAIRTRKDIDVCYAFVEFEDMTGVHNAIKASTVEIGGHQLFIEGRRPNRNSLSRGRGRGRGRFNYLMEGGRGRFGGRNFGRGSGQDGGDRDYNRSRGNGFYRPGARQERVFSGNQLSQRNGQSSE